MIPNANGQIRQLGRGDRFGELWQTKNIDLHTSPGKLKLARPFKQVCTASTLGNNVVQAFAMYQENAHALTDTALFKASSPYTSWASIDTTPDSAQDMVVFDDFLVITTATNLDAWDGSSFTSDWWTARGNTALTSNSPAFNIPHILEVIRIGAETLAVTDGNVVRAYTGLVDASTGTSVTVDFDAAFTTTCIKSSIRKVWIGTFTGEIDQAYVFEWDGASTNYTQAFPVGARAVLAMELIDNVPLIVTERGEIKIFNNAGFTTVAQFPFALKPVFADGVETSGIQNSNTSRPIHPKGMKRQGNTVFIMTAWQDVSNTDRPIDEQTPSGLWALDLTTWSLTHLGSPSNEAVLRATGPVMILNDSSTRIFIGGQRETSADEEGIWVEDLDDTSENRGIFTTVEMDGKSIQDIFTKVVVDGFLGTTDEVVLKYRSERKVDYPLVVEDVAWASTTQFNTTTDLSDVEVGDEVEFLLGTGAGKLAHVTAIETSAATYAVTIDEAIGTVATTSDVRFDNWKKVNNTYTAVDKTPKVLGINATGTWHQLRFYLKGKAGRPEIRKVLSQSNPLQK